MNSTIGLYQWSEVIHSLRKTFTVKHIDKNMTGINAEEKETRTNNKLIFKNILNEIIEANQIVKIIKC